MSPGPRVSVYVSVLNEAESIARLLDSLARQTRPPDEVLVIDGGSGDGTIERVEQFQALHPSTRLVRAPGTNIAQARNEGFRVSTFDWVGSIDAGCTADARWLEALVGATEPSVDIVSGVYVPDAQTLFERCVGDLTYPRADDLPQDWNMPSHRSVLIRKRVWEALGGFPPNLDRSEDTWFNLEAARRGFRFRLARDAVVYWRPRRNLVEVLRNTVRWTSSDIEHSLPQRYSRRSALERLGGSLVPIGWCLALLMTATASPLLGFLSLMVFTGFLVWPFRVVRRFPEERSARALLWKNLILLTDSNAWILGYIHGRLTRAGNRLARRKEA